MNPNLYVIKGSPDWGKTSACWKLLNLIKPLVECYNYWEISPNDSIQYNTANLWYEFPVAGKPTNPVDFVLVARLNNISHCKVAIISEGDGANLLKKRIYKMLSKDVHHIVCCEHTINKAGSTNKMLHDEFHITSKNEYPLKKKQDPSDESRVANDLYNILSKL